MNKLYMGIDSGALYTKGVIIDKYNNIIASEYTETEGNPIKATKKVISNMGKNIDFDTNEVVSVGVTGVAKRLIGTLLDSQIIKDEITSEVKAIRIINPDVKTIMAIGGEHAKFINIEDDKIDKVVAMTSCLVENGSFLSSLVRKMDIKIEDVSDVLKKSKNKIKISEKCSVFLEEELTSKIKDGYKQEDLLAAVSRMIANNYYKNITRTGKIVSPIMAIGGVTRNELVVKELERLVGEEIIVDKNSLFMGAIGVGILARESKKEKIFNFDVENLTIDTKMVSCSKCTNNCNIVVVYRNNKLIDSWGNKCESKIC